VENIGNRELRPPVASPSTARLTVIEQLERRVGLLSAGETCQILGIHKKTLYRRLRSRDLAGIRDHGKWKVDPRVLADYIRRRMG
jgi:helix-turn-helix protein